MQNNAAYFGGKVKIVKVDIDRNPLAASKFQVRGVPTLLLFQKGQVLWRQSGVVPTHQLIQHIQTSLLAKA
jgi:thioredoxin 1